MNKLVYYMTEKNWGVRREYSKYLDIHEECSNSKAKKFKIIWQLNWHYRILRRKDYCFDELEELEQNVYAQPYMDIEAVKPTVKKTESEISHISESGSTKRTSEQKDVKAAKPTAKKTGSKVSRKDDISESMSTKRMSEGELVAIMSEYDVISFDIFDTVILRNVLEPKDVFEIMASEMGFSDFCRLRVEAESAARKLKDKKCDIREVTLEEIYDVLNNYYGIDKSIMQREIEIEKDLCRANPYFLKIYKLLLFMEKTVIFMTDMYLPKAVIEDILHSNGYDVYDEVFLSNELGICKGDGKLQRYVYSNYLNGRTAFHIGDNYNSDVRKARAAGFEEKYYPSVREAAANYIEPNLDGIAGSFYRGIINNALHNGTWSENIHYEYGFKTGGILTCGYCDFINKTAREKGTDLILFCSRDCDVVHKVYNKHYKMFDNEYIYVSRFALLSLMPERFMYDIFNRSILKNHNLFPNKNIKMLLEDAGLECLLPYLDEYGLTPYCHPGIAKMERLKQFVLSHADIVKANASMSIEGAKKYFSDIIGNHKSILVVDIGWSGSSITALKHFTDLYFPSKGIDVYGTLLLADRTKWTTINISNGLISPYITSALNDILIAQKQFDKMTKDENSFYTERLFTSTDSSLESYNIDDNGNVVLIFGGNKPENADLILEMQRGIKDFSDTFNKVTAPYKQMCYISPYIAYAPFLSNLKRRNYLKDVYKSFKDDSIMMKYPRQETDETDEDRIFPIINTSDEFKGKILFISHEMTYTGAPHSLLRVCKVVLSLGYKAEVWSFRDGNFTHEFEQLNVPVIILNSRDKLEGELTARLTDFKLAILNTISTDRMVKIISNYIPIIWYIREATNIPEMCENDPERFSTFASCRDLVCVSDYAADFIRKYNPNVSVVHNCVEDVSNLCDTEVKPHSKVRFLTLGTIERRKGYDVLLDAYSALPDEYKSKVEIVFAGGLRSGFKYFWDPILKRAEECSGIVYMGEISDTKEKVNLYAWSDVVVVASRDESCSLVALEGAMMSKALIVTENVGAKYMVSEENGFIVKTGNAVSLAEAIMKLVDNKEKLTEMGKASRAMYEQYANMESHRRDISAMIENRLSEGIHPLNTDTSIALSSFETPAEEYKTAFDMVGKQVIVSLTSHPPRIKNIHKCIKTLLEQDLKPSQTILWLAREQFPNGERHLPGSLLDLKKRGLEIRWCDDLGSHKKYFYTMQENPEAIVITVDDDAYYQPDTIRLLCESYLRYPHAVSALRAHSITLNENGKIRKYDNWIKEDQTLYLHPTYCGIGTGIGGILYPPHALDPEVFNKEKMLELCPNCDDIWLKVMSLANGYPTVLAEKNHETPLINEAQDCALYLANVYDNANDVCIMRAFEYYNEYFDGPALAEYLKYPVGGFGTQIELIDSLE